ncbi:MAG: hypothetical protein ACK42L_06765, partial [Thermoanaerobaculum sp.]
NVSGFASARSFTIQLSGDTVPAPLKAIDLEVSIAGRTTSQRYPAAPNQRVNVVWDGKDAYGRTYFGSLRAKVRVGYVYDGIYQEVPQFGYWGNGQNITGVSGRRELTFWRELEGTVTHWDHRAVGLGGWSLSAHHVFEPVQGMIRFGDGRLWHPRSPADYRLETVLGNGTGGRPVEGSPGTDTAIPVPMDVAIGPDGSIYVATTSFSCSWSGCEPGYVLKLDPQANFQVHILVGPGVPGTNFCGGVVALDVASDGTVYFVNSCAPGVQFSAYRLRPGGQPELIAGGSSHYHCPPQRGDGGPSQNSCLWWPHDIAVGPDGSVYIAEQGTGDYDIPGSTYGAVVRRIDPNGIIHTVAGGGTRGFYFGYWSGCADPTIEGYPATEVCLSTETKGVAVGPDGSLWLADFERGLVRRVDPAGIIHRVSKFPYWGNFCGENLPSREVCVNKVTHGSFGPDGAYYVGVWGFEQRVIWRIDPEGVASYVVGQVAEAEYPDCFTPDGAPPRESRLCEVYGVAVDAQGALYFAESTHRVRRVFPPSRIAGSNGYLLPSPSGNELYFFDLQGRHQWTKDALTGALRYQFSYDSDGRLTAITDGNGQITSITHSGSSVTITAPHGQQTVITLDANGYAHSITGPDGTTHAYTYSSDGLMLTETDPKGNSAQLVYDTDGRLVGVVDAAGGVTSVSRSVSGDAQEVTVTSPSGRTTTYRQEVKASGQLTSSVINSACGCSQGETVKHPDGTVVTTSRDGTVSTSKIQPDPRFGVLAPVLKESTTKLPSGLTRTVHANRTVELANPHDPLSLTKQTDTVTVNGKQSTTVYEVTAQGQRRRTHTSPSGRERQEILDEKGRVVAMHIPGLVPVQYSYNAQGQLVAISEGARTTTFSYNPQGLLAASTDPLGRTTSYEYDASGRVIQQTLPDGREILFSYDPNGNLTSLTPPTRPPHGFTYTPLNQQSEYLPPPVGNFDPA